MNSRKNDTADKSIDIAIGRALREERKSCRLRQQDIADLLGVSYQQIQKYESGKNRLSLSNLVDMVRGSEISLAAILNAAFRGAEK